MSAAPTIPHPPAREGPLVQRYRLALGLVAFVIYCSYVPSFLFLLGHTTVNPGTVVVVFFLVSGLLWFLFDRTFGSPVTLTTAWVMAFVVLNLATLVVHGGGVEFNQRIAGALSILFLVWFVLPDRVSSTSIQWFLFIFALFNLLCVAYDFFFPGWFVPEGSPFYNPGRGAGFFVNANKSGIAATFVVILAAFTDRTRLLLRILTLCAAWALLTLSRSAILVFIVVCVILLATGKLKMRDLLGPVALGVVLGVLGIGYYLLEEGSGIASIEERAMWLTSAGGAKDFALDERSIAASGAIRAFFDHPWFGNGFGSANRLFGLPAHNLYLEFAADYGIAGVIAILAFMAAMFLDWRRAGSPQHLRAPLFAWIAAMALLSLFFDEAIGITQFMFTAAWFQRALAPPHRSP